MSESPLGQAMMRAFGEQARPAVRTYEAILTAGGRAQVEDLKRDALAYQGELEQFSVGIHLPHIEMRTEGPRRAIGDALMGLVDRIGITEDSRLVIEQHDYGDETRIRFTTHYPPAVKQWHDKAQRVDAAEARMAALEAEVAHMRAVMGWSASTDNAPALGSPDN